MTFVKGYFRGQHRPAYIKTHEQLWNEFVALSVLDGEEFDDLSDERKQQMRETM